MTWICLTDAIGFDETTVADIAERAGLTSRTFFRYFAAKREVRFLGSAALQEQLVTALADAPPVRVTDGRDRHRSRRRSARAAPGSKSFQTA